MWCEIHNLPKKGTFPAQMSPKNISVIVNFTFFFTNDPFLQSKMSDKVDYSFNLVPTWREIHNFHQTSWG